MSSQHKNKKKGLQIEEKIIETVTINRRQREIAKWFCDSVY